MSIAVHTITTSYKMYKEYKNMQDTYKNGGTPHTDNKVLINTYNAYIGKYSHNVRLEFDPNDPNSNDENRMGFLNIYLNS